ncbi:MAG: membrane protein insertion efficiency factor YidD [Clostridia bacterium]|nr:membrane protein insertion efficiency factor YidD [Clostridia bacterium]
MKKQKFFLIILKFIYIPFNFILYGGIYFYKFLISPLLPHSCKFIPTCSTYTLRAIKEFGPFTGFIKGFNRIIKCNPFNKGGFDPVPYNIKGEIKWLI